MTRDGGGGGGDRLILIHTSVKLVTTSPTDKMPRIDILIHTSVKLVTMRGNVREGGGLDFNPHEREARDLNGTARLLSFDYILIHTSVKLVTKARCLLPCECDDFNPHEREARDVMAAALSAVSAKL